jgi:hypothetical protein
MRKRIATTFAALGAVAAIAGGGAGIASAQHGADDPANHQRHSGLDDGARHHNRHHRHHRGGADDGVNHERHGGDDGPNHG